MDDRKLENINYKNEPTVRHRQADKTKTGPSRYLCGKDRFLKADLDRERLIRSVTES